MNIFRYQMKSKKLLILQFFFFFFEYSILVFKNMYKLYFEKIKTSNYNNFVGNYKKNIFIKFKKILSNNKDFFPNINYLLNTLSYYRLQTNNMSTFHLV